MDILTYGAILGGTMYGMLNDPLVVTYLGVVAAAAFLTDSKALIAVVIVGFVSWHLAVIWPRPININLIALVAGYVVYGLVITGIARLVLRFTPVRNTSDS